MDEVGGEDDLYREWQERMERYREELEGGPEEEADFGPNIDHMLVDEPWGDEEQQQREDQLQQHLEVESQELAYRVEMVEEHVAERA